MADFDWNQYQPEAQGFDWGQYATDSAEAIQQPSTSQADAFARGGIQGATLGFRDELAGALASPSGAGKAALELLGGDYAQDEDVAKYKAERDESRAIDQAAEKANPGTYTGALIGGGLALPLAAAAALPAGAAGLLGAGGTLGGVTAAGTLTGLGNSKADSLGGLAGDAAVGGALGAASYGLGKAVPVVADKLGSLAGKAGDFIEGVSTSAGQKLGGAAERLASTAAVGKSDQGIGRELLDQGLVRFGDTTQNIADRVGARVQGAQGSANSILDDLIKNEPTARGALAADAFKEGGARAAPFKAMFPDSAAAYGEQKAIIDRLKPIGTAAVNRANSSGQNIGAGDLLSYGAGAVTAGPVGGVIAPLARRAVGDRAISSGAVGLDKASRFLLNPETLKNIAPKIGKYGTILTNAAERSQHSLATTHFLLEKTDGEYREAMRQALEGGQ